MTHGEAQKGEAVKQAVVRDTETGEEQVYNNFIVIGLSGKPCPHCTGTGTQVSLWTCIAPQSTDAALGALAFAMEEVAQQGTPNMPWKFLLRVIGDMSRRMGLVQPTTGFNN